MPLSLFEVIVGILEKEVVVSEDLLEMSYGEIETTSGRKKKEKLRGTRAAPYGLRRLVVEIRN